MEKNIDSKPTDKQISSYGVFSLLFVEITNIIYSVYSSCNEVEKDAKRELRNIRISLFLHYIGFLLMPYTVVLLQLNSFMKNYDLENGVYLFIFFALAVCSNVYLFKVIKHFAAKKKIITKNLNYISDIYTRLVASTKTDFTNFLNNKFENISFFSGMSEEETQKSVSVLDSMNIDLVQLDTAYRHSSFININPQFNDKELRQNALKHVDSDFKKFELTAL